MNENLAIILAVSPILAGMVAMCWPAITHRRKQRHTMEQEMLHQAAVRIRELEALAARQPEPPPNRPVPREALDDTEKYEIRTGDGRIVRTNAAQYENPPWVQQ